jgi:hypothetical protein
MKPGQTRVLVLLIVLFAMEAVVHPGIKQWLQAAKSQVSGALSMPGQPSQTATSATAGALLGATNLNPQVRQGLAVGATNLPQNQKAVQGAGLGGILKLLGK